MRVRASAIVGRDDELSTVEHALAVARAGRGGAVFVVGEAGIGKSRLATAAADLAMAAGMCLLRGRGSTVGPMVPFRSLTEALMSLLRSGDPVDVSELGPYRPILARLVPDWGEPLAAGNEGSLVILAEAVLRLTGLAGRGRGCLFVLDDLQDSDAETLAVVDYLASNLGQQPALLLGTVRAEQGPAHDLVQAAVQRGCGVMIELRRFDAENVRQFAGSCLGCDPGDVPGRVAEHLWAAGEGVPLLTEELLDGLLREGLLARASDGWRVAGTLGRSMSVTLARAMAGRLDRVGSQGRDLLALATVLGQRFPLDVLQVASGLDHRELLSHLHTEPVAQLVAADEELTDWFAFRHPLIVEVLLTLLTPAERSQFARRAAAAVESVYPGLPGEWCQVSASLRLQAGDRGPAGRLFTEAGRRALAQGAANSAVSLLDRALELLSRPSDAQERAEALAALLHALAEAGLVERALEAATELDRLASLLSPGTRARLHTRLAWAAVVAGRSSDGLAQVDVARALLGPDAPDRDTAPIDVVAAHLMLDLPGPEQARIAECLARRAAAVAEAADLPVVGCQAWQLLGALSRSRDPSEATACLERAQQLAVRHNLPIQEIHALVRLGNDDALRDGGLARLELARREATRAGAVTARYQAEASIALQAILRGDFTTAETLIGQVLVSTTRLRLVETTQYTLLLQAILGAHRGRRRDMDAALAELRRWEGDHALHAPRVYGLARAWCALMEEDRSRAMRELNLALAAEEQSPTIFQLTGRYGLHLLLRVLDGTAGEAEYQALTATPVSRLRWDRQFALFAGAVLAGRAGRATEAAEMAHNALRVAEPYATGRRMGLRLVSEAAIADGWGSPIEWLRESEEFFHASEVQAVASACRALMRRAGVPIGQRRRGAQRIPSMLRAAGVTVREYEVLCLLTNRLSNREIASRLQLSPRTVEKHVASLITKTGQRNRVALGEFASAAAGNAKSRRL